MIQKATEKNLKKINGYNKVTDDWMLGCVLNIKKFNYTETSIVILFWIHSDVFELENKLPVNQIFQYLVFDPSKVEYDTEPLRINEL